MKKFFSLVLALVMALSLTTVAWGADPVTYTANDETTLATAVSSAGAGDTIKLTASITVANGITVAPGVIIDGGNNTLKVTAAGDKTADGVSAAIYSTDGITVKNLTIDGGARGIYVATPTSADTLTKNIVLDNVTILNSCRAFNVTGNCAAGVTLTVSDSTLAGKISYSGSLASVTFTNCEFVTNGGAKGDVVEMHSATDFDNCVFEGDFDVAIDAEANPNTVVSMEDCVYDGVAVTEDNKATIFGDALAAKTTAGATSGVTTNFYGADANATSKWYLIDTFPGATIANFLVEADYDDGNMGGYLEHYNIEGVLYLAATKATGSYKLVCGNVEIYLNPADIDEIFYVTEAEVFTGVTTDEDACGKVLVAKKNLSKTYYTATIVDNKVEYTYYFVADKTGDPILVNNKIVKASYVGDDFSDDADNTFVTHSWVGNEVDATTKAYTSIICENCGKVAKLYANADAAGKKAVYLSGFGWITAADAGYDAPVVVPSTPSTDKTVTSAETFDAGIAMYVGMSVLAATGSAVVIGKKKD